MQEQWHKMPPIDIANAYAFIKGTVSPQKCLHYSILHLRLPTSIGGSLYLTGRHVKIRFHV